MTPSTLPEWDVWFPEFGQERGDGRTVCAYTADQAVAAAAELDDARGDYTIIGSGSTTDACAARVGSERVFRGSVWGESVPSYHARMKEGA